MNLYIKKLHPFEERQFINQTLLGNIDAYPLDFKPPPFLHILQTYFLLLEYLLKVGRSDLLLKG